MKYFLLLYTRYLKPVVYCLTAMSVLMGAALLIREIVVLNAASTTGIRIWVWIIFASALYWAIWFVIRAFTERKK